MAFMPVSESLRIQALESTYVSCFAVTDGPFAPSSLPRCFHLLPPLDGLIAASSILTPGSLGVPLQLGRCSAGFQLEGH